MGHQVKIHLKNLLDQVKLKSLQPAAMRPRRNLEAKKTRKNSTRDTTKVIISTRAAIITRKVTSTEVIVTEAKKIIIVNTNIVIIKIVTTRKITVKVITRVILIRRIINVISVIT